MIRFSAFPVFFPYVVHYFESEHSNGPNFAQDSFQGLPSPDLSMDEAYFSAGDFSSFEGESNAARFQQLLMAFKLNDTVRVMIPGCIFDTVNKYGGWQSSAGNTQNVKIMKYYTYTLSTGRFCAEFQQTYFRGDGRGRVDYHQSQGEFDL